MAKFGEMAKVLRSKNSGPFEITLDILFDDSALYKRAIDSGVLTRETVAALYHIPAEYVTVLVAFGAALGIKITYLRDVSSGSFGDRDVYGAQQHVPLMDLEIP
ncbi:MAG TPA: DUF4387 domain-containing protein [Candidatus Limiplasma sp.]|nr:DUF4387 domain-containing protein [Candidatus Limiplasma sp.]